MGLMFSEFLIKVMVKSMWREEGKKTDGVIIQTQVKPQKGSPEKSKSKTYFLR